MKLGYITKQDPNDVLAYSGTHYCMFQALKNKFEIVIPLGPIKEPFSPLPKIYGRLLRIRSNKIYKYQYNIGLAKRAARIIDQRILDTNPDVLLASLMSPEVAFVKSNIPLYITTDATFPLLKDVYKSHSHLHSKSIKEAMYLEEKAFKKATKLLLPLNWLADSAMKHYDVPAKKIEVIPYGSNLGIGLEEDGIKALIQQRVIDQKLRLLFVGVRWEEKGGPFSVEVIDELQKLGVESELTIAGCDPEIDPKKLYIKKVGFFDKSDSNQKTAFIDLYKKAHFFIIPTSAECVGMSFIEATSVGLPAVGTDVGGVPEAVIDGETGLIIRKDYTAKDVARWIKEQFYNELTYKKFAENSFKSHQRKLNWKSWASTVHQIIHNQYA